MVNFYFVKQGRFLPGGESAFFVETRFRLLTAWKRITENRG